MRETLTNIIYLTLFLMILYNYWLIKELQPMPDKKISPVEKLVSQPPKEINESKNITVDGWVIGAVYTNEYDNDDNDPFGVNPGKMYMEIIDIKNGWIKYTFTLDGYITEPKAKRIEEMPKSWKRSG